MIGVVEQDCFLFHDSIYNNIVYGLSDVSLDDIQLVALAAHAHDFITELPDGYDYFGC